jgi:hypothetical protein
MPKASAEVVTPPPAPPSAPEPAWIPPARVAHQRKKKAALTPKEALRAKVQARAVKQALHDGAAGGPKPRPPTETTRPAAPVEPGESEAPEAPVAATAEVVAEQPARAAAKPKPLRAKPPAPRVEEVEEIEEPAPPPAKPGFFQRLLDVFRKRKPAPPEE